MFECQRTASVNGRVYEEQDRRDHRGHGDRIVFAGREKFGQCAEERADGSRNKRMRKSCFMR